MARVDLSRGQRREGHREPLGYGAGVLDISRGGQPAQPERGGHLVGGEVPALRPGRELGQRRHLRPGHPRCHPPSPGQEPDQLVIGQPHQPFAVLPGDRVQDHGQQRPRRHGVRSSVLGEPLQGQLLRRRGDVQALGNAFLAVPAVPEQPGAIRLLGPGG